MICGFGFWDGREVLMGKQLTRTGWTVLVLGHATGDLSKVDQTLLLPNFNGPLA